MEIRELESFIQTAELLHFGRASRACNLSPSALTRTIQRLEEDVGQLLFLRDNRSVSLTPAGEQLLRYARRTVQEWQHFQNQLLQPQAVRGTLSLYASITAVYSLLPDLLETYRKAYPEVQLELNTGAAEQALDQVLRGEIDLAVAALPNLQRTRIEFMPLTETPLVFIAPANIAGNTLNLSKDPLVLPRSGLARRRLDHWLKTHQQQPNISSEVSGNEAIIAMVRLGCGIGIVPQLVLERSPFRDEVRTLNRAPQLDPYIVGLCTTQRNLKRPAIRALWDLADSL